MITMDSLLQITFLLINLINLTYGQYRVHEQIEIPLECDYENIVPFDGCFNFKYECQEQCLLCFKGQCLWYIQNYQQSCFFGQCFLNQENVNSYSGISDQIISNQNNLSICGDNIISQDEECEDGNHFPFDGCFNCKYQCEELCQECVKGFCIQKYPNKLDKETVQIPNFKEISNQLSQTLQFSDEIEINCTLLCRICIDNICIQCIDGYNINESTNMCETYCGDNIIQGQEECDDGNLNNYDGCSNCKRIQYNQCNQEEQNFCSVCYFGKCLMCNEGYLLQDYTCTSQCGDGLVNTIDFEECDNPNEKGCINCKIDPSYLCVAPYMSLCYTCDQYCITCQGIEQQLTCETCQDGYYPVGKLCKKCDENCVTCQDQSFLCTSCYRNDCDFCESQAGLYTDAELKVCISKCGDGVLIKQYEQCDDGNLEDGDGCDSTCILEGQSNYYQDLQELKMVGLYSYDFQMGNDFQKFTLDCENVIINIDSYNSSQFEYYQEVNQDSCRIKFTFFQSIYKYNKIHVIFYFQEANQRILQISENKIQFDIEPEEYLIQSNDQQSQADSISSAQESFGLIFLIFIPISIITNLFDYLWAILEILSWINNFYFLNVRYPFNVEIFFINSDWTQIFNFPTYQGLNQPDCEYYFKAPSRFQSKGINPLYLNNAQIPLMFIFSSIIIYLIIKFLAYIFMLLKQKNQITKFEKHFSIFKLNDRKNTEKKNSEIKTEAQIQQVHESQLLISLIKLLKQLQLELKKKIKQTVSLCLLDLTLAIMLQLNNAENLNNIIVSSNQILAFLSISLIIFQLHQSYQTINIHHHLAESKFYKEKYYIYYENINTNSTFGFKYKFVGLLRKILYIFFLVYYYNNPLLQTILCFITTNFGLALILYQNPFNNRSQFFFQFIQDFTLSTIIFITILFAFNDQTQVSFIEDNKIILGWIIIALVLLALLAEILVLIYELVKSLYSFLKFLRRIFQKRHSNKNEIGNEDQNADEQLKVSEQSQIQYQIKLNKQKIIFSTQSQEYIAQNNQIFSLKAEDNKIQSKQ